MKELLHRFYIFGILVAATPIAFAAQPVTTTIRSNWVRSLPAHFQPTRFFTDQRGYTFGTGGFFNTNHPDAEHAYDMGTLRLDRLGRSTWLATADGEGGWDWGDVITTDAGRNIYVSGRSEWAVLTHQILTIKYSPNGRGIWTNRFRLRQYEQVYVTSIAADGEGNAAVTFRMPTNHMLIKVSADGTPAWERNLGPPTVGIASRGDYSVVFDSHGNVIVSGGGGRTNLLGALYGEGHTTKFGPDGIVLWSKPFHENNLGYSAAVAVGRNDQVFVAALSDRRIVYPFPPPSFPIVLHGFPGPPIVVPVPVPIFNSWQHVLVSYAPDGTALWTNYIPVMIDTFDLHPPVLATDREGAVYLAGQRGGIELVAFVMKVGRHGHRHWKKETTLPPRPSFGIRFGRVTPHYVTLFSDSLQFGVDSPQMTWFRTEVLYQEKN